MDSQAVDFDQGETELYQLESGVYVHSRTAKE